MKGVLKMSKYTDIAKSVIGDKKTTLTENRTKIDMAEIIAKYPLGITVTEFEIVESDTPYGIFLFEEEPDRFFFGGSGMTSIAYKWKENDGSCELASAGIKADGGVRIKFIATKTKKGRDYIKPIIVI